MKRKTSLVAGVLAAALILPLTACSGGSEGEAYQDRQEKASQYDSVLIETTLDYIQSDAPISIDVPRLSE